MKRSNHLSQPVYIPDVLQDDTVLFARHRYGFYGPLEGVLDDERDANERIRSVSRVRRSESSGTASDHL